MGVTRPVELVVDTLELVGVPPSERAPLIAAVEAELAALLAREGVPEAWETEGVVELPERHHRLRRGATLAETARRVAEALLADLREGPRQ